MAEKAKEEISAVGEQLKQEISTVTMKADVKIGALTASLKRAVKKVSELEEQREASTRKLDDLCEGKERVKN